MAVLGWTDDVLSRGIEGVGQELDVESITDTIGVALHVMQSQMRPFHTSLLERLNADLVQLRNSGYAIVPRLHILVQTTSHSVCRRRPGPGTPSFCGQVWRLHLETGCGVLHPHRRSAFLHLRAVRPLPTFQKLQPLTVKAGEDTRAKARTTTNSDVEYEFVVRTL